MYIADSMGIRDIYEADGNGVISTNEPLVVLVSAKVLKYNNAHMRLLFANSIHCRISIYR